MPPISLAPLSGRYLSFAEREEIAILHAQHVGIRTIARHISRSPSTVSRELRRNAATRSGGLEYRATTAQWHADRRARRPKVAKLAVNNELRRYVHDRLAGMITAANGTRARGPHVHWNGRRQGRRQDRRWAASWSPEQIANRLKVDFPEDESMRISHEAIYQALYVQGRGALRRELVACLRTGRALRVPRARTRGRGKKFVTADILISKRPAEVEDRAVPGHWEGDLIVGLGSSAIGTLVERTTRFTMLLTLPRMDDYGQPRIKNGPALAGHGAEAVRDAIASSIITLPTQLRRSLTWDQGAEMAQHVRAQLQTLFAANRRLFKAYVLREQLDRLWMYKTRTGVLNFLNGWCDALRWQRLPEMERLGAFLFKHLDGIAAYCDHQVRFGVVESINTTIKAVLRRARGMRDEAMLVLKLKWATARPIRSARDVLRFVHPEGVHSQW